MKIKDILNAHNNDFKIVPKKVNYDEKSTKFNESFFKTEYHPNGVVKSKSKTENSEDYYGNWVFQYYDSGILKSKTWFYNNDHKSYCYYEYNKHGDLKLFLHYSNNELWEIKEYNDYGQLTFERKPDNEPFNQSKILEYSLYEDNLCLNYKTYDEKIHGEVKIFKMFREHYHTVLKRIHYRFGIMLPENIENNINEVLNKLKKLTKMCESNKICTNSDTIFTESDYNNVENLIYNLLKYK